MATVTLKSGAETADAELSIDSRNPRVSSLHLRAEVGEITQLDVTYAMPEFDIEHEGVRVECRGTSLGDEEERAVLRYLKDKYED
ncbi:hypothetical protein [Vreelandella populi]|uniref:hypothetical protein n=1 Tax=Vreelandella populi TaxID=2498858 RepID=UPI000F8C8C98|nr:hypothetical protein [Halomonas populi]RUR52700.1 hypothetical protein ELY40_11660 [Halomonas populi]